MISTHSTRPVRAPKRRVQNNTRRRVPSGKPPARYYGFLLKLALVCLVVVGGLFIYFDAVVQAEFAGKRWTIPAKVYARPLEIFAGLSIARDDFITELSALGYKRVHTLNGPGEVSVAGDTIALHTRGFQFYEGTEPAQKVRIRFSGNHIATLQKLDGRTAALVRLEPLLMGGLYPAHNEDRILVQLASVPQELIQTLLAAEDRDFFNHAGVSLRAIARALWVNSTAGELRQGGSTLTQQLVKNFFLSNERSLTRKLTEAVMAVLLELHFSKDAILEAYLNEVFLGQDGRRAIHGFGLASQYYFNQPLTELNIQQIALLVGLVKGPSYYNPRRQPERALERRNLVLDLLASQSIITPEQATQAKRQPLGITQRGSLANNSYPAFMSLVKRQLRDDYPEAVLTEEGLKIFTSLDPLRQRAAEQAISNTLGRLEKRPGVAAIEAAMVVAHPETGEIQALIGSKDSRFAGFNRAVDAQRPIGSLIKPAVYLAALERPSQYSLTSWVRDEPVAVKGQDGKVWRPQNFDRKIHGEVFLYQALAHSYNLATVHLGLAIGVPQVLKTLERMGVTQDWPDYPSMLLGAGALSPLQVTSMYQTIANGGFNTPLRTIRSVLTAQGTPLKSYPLETQQRFNAGAVFLLRHALEQVMREGTGRSVYNQLPESLNVAGKTGTSNDSRDSWFAGFSQDVLAVVWLGRDDNGKTPLTGATGALQVWTEFMQKAQPLSLDNQLPDNVTNLWIDQFSGAPSGLGCPGAIQIPYIRANAPAAGMDCTTTAPVTTPPLDWVRGWIN